MELRDYLFIIRQRKWWVIATVLLATAATLVYSLFLQPKVYEAISRVVIKEQPAAASALARDLLEELSTQPERSVQTQVELIKSKTLAERVVRSLQLGMEPESLASKLSVELLGKTNIIEIRMRDGNPVIARDLAIEYARQYQEWRIEESAKGLRSAASEMMDKSREAEEDVRELSKQFSDKVSSKDLSEEDKLKLQNAVSKYLESEQELRKLTVAEELVRGQYEILLDEKVPDRPVSPRPARNGTLAFLASLLLGLGLAFLADYLNDTIDTREEAERLAEAPILGEIPREEGREEGRSMIVMVTSPKSSTAESFRALRTNIQFINYEQDIKSLMFTSAGPEAGKSFIVANLGVALAEAGHRVLVICADMRKPNLHNFFHLDNKIGLSTVLIGRASMEECLSSSGMANLKVLTSGPLPPNSSELLGSRRMNEVLERARQMADLVLLDTPPVLATSDAAVLGPRVDGAVLVLSAGTSRRDETRKMRVLLEQVKTRILGVVLNNVSETHSYGYYYYYYSYGERHGKKK